MNSTELTAKWKAELSKRHNIEDAYMNAENTCLNVIAKSQVTLAKIAVDLAQVGMKAVSWGKPGKYLEFHTVQFTK